ncbi:hypothetical protein C7212DRAFT_276618 [Tuber magnatum]|uniref:Uncharacterized protein n=1 Tax=Tuber magnatum TaxID=42249 RepID=A0A317SUX0_9PEZI|nr:hypothetical protein C7212DRAFT_276618 [Tuber magnatum]
MKFTTVSILLPILLPIATTVAAPTGPSSEPLITRDLKLPTDYGKNCRTTQLTGSLQDATNVLREGFNDVRIMVLGAMQVSPTAYNKWFEKWLPIEDYHLFLKLCASVNEYVLPQSEFGTIFVDCEAPTPACDRLKEPDHTTTRIAVTNPENNVLYACFKMFDPAHAEYRRPLSALIACPDEDGGVPSISNWQMLATTLAREIAHTSALIRRMGPPYLFTDNKLHAKIDRFGWMVTHAYFQRHCGYAIPFGKDRWEYKPDLANIEEVFRP